MNYKLEKYQYKLLKNQFGGKLPIFGYHRNIGGKNEQQDRLSVVSYTPPKVELPENIKESVRLAKLHNLVPPQVKKTISKEFIIFSVFDGHGGIDTSEYLNNTLPNRCKDAIEALPNLADPNAISNIVRQKMIEIDHEDNRAMKHSYIGSTGTICVVTDKHIIVNNVADSPAILFTNEGVLIEKTNVHNCNKPEEEARINQNSQYPLCKVTMYKEGEPYKRLASAPTNIGLDMTRAFGDNKFKPKADATPESYIWNRKSGDILCVCSDSFFEDSLDGMKEVQNEQDVINEIYPILVEKNFDPQSTAIRVVNRRAHRIHKDNTSMILAIF